MLSVDSPYARDVSSESILLHHVDFPVMLEHSLLIWKKKALIAVVIVTEYTLKNKYVYFG